MNAIPLRSHRARLGATLTEILIATLIMGIGVVSVFTLFPISVLRTVQATNRTNAKILKENTVDQISTSPDFLTAFTPSTNAAPNSPLNNFNMRQQWAPRTNYGGPPVDVVVPTMKPGTSVPRPWAYFQVTTAGTSGITEPDWNVPAGATINDGTVQWTQLTGMSRYVIDPLGLNLARTDGQSAAVVDIFGNQTNTSTGAVTALGLVRTHGGLTGATAAEALAQTVGSCAGGDSWQQVLQAVPILVNSTSIVFPPTTDLSGIFPPAASAVVRPRVVLTTLDGGQTVVRDTTGVPAGQVVNWQLPLPTSFQRPRGSGAFEVGSARIEVYNRRYTWFLTVRNIGPKPEVKCVVVFNRSGASAEEHAYVVNFGNSAIDGNGDGTADPIQRNQAVIAWQPGAAGAWNPTGSNAFEPAPLIKAGNWIFDARDASWYRIQSVDLTSSTTAAPRWAFVTLDQSVRAMTPDDGTGPPANPNPPGLGILMPGIIDVFDL